MASWLRRRLGLRLDASLFLGPPDLAGPQARQHLQGIRDAWRNHFFQCRPPEHSARPLDLVFDVAPAPAHLDHSGANLFEHLGAEISSRDRVAGVKQHLSSFLQVTEFRGLPAVAPHAPLLTVNEEPYPKICNRDDGANQTGGYMRRDTRQKRSVR